MKEKDIKRGDVVWIDKTLSINLGDNVQNIDRPYVVISNNLNNANAPTVNLACLSKKVQKSNYPMHVFISGKKYGLDCDSVIYTEQVLTVNKDKITDRIMRLDSEDTSKLNNALMVQFLSEVGDVKC